MSRPCPHRIVIATLLLWGATSASGQDGSPQAGFAALQSQAQIPAQGDATAQGEASVESGERAIPLRPRNRNPSSPTNSSSPSRTNNTLTTVAGALAVCLGVFFLVVWFTKRNAPQGNAKLPTEVLESLGRLPVNARQHLQMFRVGRKLILVNMTASGAETLTEITDPAEVERLVGICRQSRPDSTTETFKQVLAEYEREPAPRGFLGDPRQEDWELATRVPRRRGARKEGTDG